MDEITEKILSLFREISSVPRCSGHEEKIAIWLKEWALSRGFSVKFDSVNNIVIGIPPSEGYEKVPAVVIQGHMDMVCEKTPSSSHDFSKDAIIPVVKGQWLKTRGTTLGADNGIAMAIALGIAEDTKLCHPPLELLFTVDEETGLTGANALMPDFIAGKVLLNLDSEEEGVFIIGCAGGLNTTISMPLGYSAVPDDALFFRLAVDGLCGGHSGINIHERRANANKILAAALRALMDSTDVYLVDIKGGSAHNAIPRYAEAIIILFEDPSKNPFSLISEFEDRMRSEYGDFESSLSITLQEIKSPQKNKAEKMTISSEYACRVVGLLNALPHGVNSMSSQIPGHVQTSVNLATVVIEDGQLLIVSSQRSSLYCELMQISEKIAYVALEYGAQFSHHCGYPPWQPDISSPLLQRCKDVYKHIFGEEARSEFIHAGLECAVIGSKYAEMDMISFGPTIKNPHSPDECLYIPSVRKVWDLLVPLLASFRE
ncbi:aminoacyl-histidine dipeptidase [Methanolobus sp. WCC5]|uniref:aminoacyl-histidine dipeptidase n=1 Tax=Methanolobus sp. WCC5 TaxID=3125785 RepID=UPI00324B828D